MKVFLTGATGFIGYAVLKKLVAAGHYVMGLVQDDTRAVMVRDAGGIPVLGDLLVPHPWEDSVKDTDLVISASSPFKITEKLSYHEAERRAGTHAEAVGNLLHAAARSSVKAVILTYHVTAFGNQGDRWASELLPVEPVGLARPVAGAYYDIEKTAKKLGVHTIEVFPGWVYGPGSWFEKLVVASIKAGTARIVGSGTNYKSLIHLDDLAEGYRLIVEKMPIGERYCLVDGHPVMQKEFVKFVAREMGKPEPGSIEYTAFAGMMGEIMAEAIDSSVRVSNNKAKTELGFASEYASFCHGVPEALKSLGIEPVTKEMPKASGF